MRLFALLGLSAILAFGQEAKIMIVERTDSTKLAAAYKSYQDAKKQWEEVKADIAKHYTMEGKKVMEGWEKVQFSADFRALVPDSSPYANHYPNCWNGLTMNTSSVPAVGTWSTGTNITSSSGTNISDFADDRTVTVDGNLTVKERQK
jgi:hypothetical protein